MVWIDSHCENLIGEASTVQLKLAISSGMGGMSAKHQPGPLAPGNTSAPENTMDTGQTITTCTQKQPIATTSSPQQKRTTLFESMTTGH